MDNPTCPVCNTEMRQTRRGATLAKRGPAYVCPLDESELYHDGDNHIRRFGWGQHSDGLRVWEPDELPQPERPEFPPRRV